MYHSRSSSVNEIVVLSIALQRVTAVVLVGVVKPVTQALATATATRTVARGEAIGSDVLIRGLWFRG